MVQPFVHRIWKSSKFTGCPLGADLGPDLAFGKPAPFLVASVHVGSLRVQSGIFVRLCLTHFRSINEQ